MNEDLRRFRFRPAAPAELVVDLIATWSLLVEDVGLYEKANADLGDDIGGLVDTSSFKTVGAFGGRKVWKKFASVVRFPSNSKTGADAFPSGGKRKEKSCSSSAS